MFIFVFTGTDAEAIPYLPLPAGAVLELTPTPHGTQVRTHILLPDDEEVTPSTRVTHPGHRRERPAPAIARASAGHSGKVALSRSRAAAAHVAPRATPVPGHTVVSLILRTPPHARRSCHDRAVRRDSLAGGTLRLTCKAFEKSVHPSSPCR